MMNYIVQFQKVYKVIILIYTFTTKGLVNGGYAYTSQMHLIHPYIVTVT